jgi:DNA polymerase III epsilon subunit family exonuclease
MIAIIFDLETTGLTLPSVAEPKKQPRILEIGAIRCGTERYNVLGIFSHLVNPEIPVDEKITKITGIKNEDILNKPTLIEIIPQFQEFLVGADLMLAHNAQFDVSVLRYELKRIERENFHIPPLIDTSQEYASRIGFLPHLVTLYEFILGEPLKQAHRALDDCQALLDVLKKDDFFGKF